jgi:hypothetical protein
MPDEQGSWQLQSLDHGLDIRRMPRHPGPGNPALAPAMQVGRNEADLRQGLGDHGPCQM